MIPCSPASSRRAAALAGTALLLLLGACATPAPAPAPAPTPAGLGESKASAIEVCMPAGQRAYLAALLCPSGQAPAFKRIGSMGSRIVPVGDAQSKQMLDQLLSRKPLAPGEPDYHVVDAYELSCGDSKRTLYLDMYHCGQPAPQLAPAGLTLKPAGS